MHKNNLVKALLIAGTIVMGFAFTRHVSKEKYGKPENMTASGNEPGTEKKFPCFLVISDTHIDTTKSRTQFGSDTGMDLWEAAAQEIKNLIATDQPKFILLLGDLPWHAKKTVNAELISARANTGFMLRSMRALAEDKKIPVLYVPGNNDPWAGNYDIFNMEGKNAFSSDSIGQYLWPMINRATYPTDNDPSIGDTSQLRLGCYTAYPLGKKSKLKIVALNSVIFVNRQPHYTGQAAADSKDEITWLDSQLHLSDSLNEAVLIAMHVPPGRDSYWESKRHFFWDSTLRYNDTVTIQDAFLDLTAKYQHRIIGVLSSHTHLDGIKILTDRKNKFSNFLISVPSVSPDHLNNPGLKVIRYNPDQNFSLMNFITHYNSFTDDGPGRWNRAYSFDREFKCSPSISMRAYFESKFRRKQTNALKKYIRAIYKVKSAEIKDSTYDMDNTLMIDYQKK